MPLNGNAPGSTWSTDPLFMKIGSEYYYYHNDHLGTPQKMTSVSGDVVWSAKYSSFGEASVEIESVTNNLRFPGQYWDGESGLHYNLWRFYSTNLGKYLKVDPIGYRLIKLSSRSPVLFNTSVNNLYSYIQNNPTNFIDPRGLFYGGTPEAHMKSCTKLKTKKKRCECICLYTTDFVKCEEQCDGCSDGKKLSAHGVCMCTCKQQGGDAKACKCACSPFK